MVKINKPKENPSPSPRRIFDWEKIKGEYRAGQLSVREIAGRFNLDEKAIRKRASAENWERALADKVRAAVREKLVRADSPQTKHTKASDAEIIETFSQRGFDLVTSHQGNIKALRNICASMAAELIEVKEHEEEIKDDIMEATKNDGKRRSRMLRAVSLYGRSGVLSNLSQALSKLIPLERQAFSIDDNAASANPDRITRIERVIVNPNHSDRIGPDRSSREASAALH
jgi:hypothetical protein